MVATLPDSDEVISTEWPTPCGHSLLEHGKPSLLEGHFLQSFEIQYLSRFISAGWFYTQFSSDSNDLFHLRSVALGLDSLLEVKVIF
jgi:hypothetical protein